MAEGEKTGWIVWEHRTPKPQVLLASPVGGFLSARVGLFERAGYQVVVAHTPQEVTDLLHEEKPVALILCCSLAEQDKQRVIAAAGSTVPLLTIFDDGEDIQAPPNRSVHRRAGDTAILVTLQDMIAMNVMRKEAARWHSLGE